MGRRQRDGLTVLTFQREPFDAAYPDAEPLLRLHYEELTFGRGRIQLAPDVGRYRALEAEGALVVHTARDDGQLVGYAAWFLTWHMHYRHNLYALNDVFFVDPARRADRWLGYRFIRHIDRDLSNPDHGIDAIKWHAKAHRDFGSMLQRLGYQPEEVIWSKVRP